MIGRTSRQIMEYIIGYDIVVMTVRCCHNRGDGWRSSAAGSRHAGMSNVEKEGLMFHANCDYFHYE